MSDVLRSLSVKTCHADETGRGLKLRQWHQAGIGAELWSPQKWQQRIKKGTRGLCGGQCQHPVMQQWTVWVGVGQHASSFIDTQWEDVASYHDKICKLNREEALKIGGIFICVVFVYWQAASIRQRKCSIGYNQLDFMFQNEIQHSIRFQQWSLSKK